MTARKMNSTNRRARMPRRLMSFKRTLAILLLLPALARAQGGTLTVVYPMEGQALPGLKETFVVGEGPPGSTLTVNGTIIPVHPKGGYLVMVPVQPGPM